MDISKNTSNLLLVDSSVLPEVFEKVVEAKKHLAMGKVKNNSEAAKLAGISRSAFYKYKDCVFVHNQEIDEKVVTISANLSDNPGVLSGIINEITKLGGNILTLNQNIPVDGVAPISISIRLEKDINLSDITEGLQKLSGIVDLKIRATR